MTGALELKAKDEAIEDVQFGVRQAAHVWEHAIKALALVICEDLGIDDPQPYIAEWIASNDGRVMEHMARSFGAFLILKSLPQVRQ